MLIAFAGLPGTGKTSIARGLARHLGATYLRIDTIEQALRSSSRTPKIEAEGYVVAYRVAEDNLRLGQTVIADSVNPLAITRDAWLAVAATANVGAVQVEIVCTDRAEHRRRVETRSSDVAGLVLPDWGAVAGREYHPWTEPRIVIDTAAKPIDACVAELLSRLPARGAATPTG
jgi:predicted kinase